MTAGLARRLFQAFWDPLVASGWPMPTPWESLHPTQREAWERVAIEAGRAHEPGQRERFRALASENAKLREAADRLVTIADEAFGLGPVEPLDETLGRIERGINEQHQRLSAVERRERELEAELADRRRDEGIDRDIAVRAAREDAKLARDERDVAMRQLRTLENRSPHVLALRLIELAAAALEGRYRVKIEDESGTPAEYADSQPPGALVASPPATVAQLLDMFAAASAQLHSEWTTAASAPGYDKAAWRKREAELERLYRSQLTALGYSGPLLRRVESGSP